MGFFGNTMAQSASYQELKVVTITAGDAKTYPKKGDKLSMHYTGTYYGGDKHGQEFDSSLNRGKPFGFTIGMGQVIKGWDEGVIQMSLGEKAVLEIPWAKGYGVNGTGPIGSKQDLKFEVELLKIN